MRRISAGSVPGLVLILATGTATLARGQAYGPPDRGEPGDEMIQAYLAGEARTLDGRFQDDLARGVKVATLRDEALEEYRYMLGLSPLPEKTPLNATVTGTVEGEGFLVENLHFQSRPGLYVTANLYRPKTIEAGRRLPAVLYVCGHSGMGRNGNKTAFQSHGIWFARHGYICLALDTLQLGEIAGVHHGTYREDRWWWWSRGYTPAGVECWNGVRGIDYLIGRPDVDADRIAVTGISGGGATTYWVAAADDRVKVAVPVSGMADLESYVGNRVVNGQCDCMFFYNIFQWPWTRIAALIAPRPMLFVNSDKDRIFPMDANERISNRMERLYSHFGAGDRFDTLVSVGGHAYRGDIRQGVYRFINTHLKGDGRPVTDGEIDAVAETRPERPYPIEPERLRAFPTDADLPKDALNAKIDETFVPMAAVELPSPGGFESWRDRLVNELKRVVFRALPDRVPAASAGKGPALIETEPGIQVELQRRAMPEGARRAVVIVSGPEGPEGAEGAVQDDDAVYVLAPRGTRGTRWTIKDPPNTIERSMALLGRTPDTGRVWDIIAAARRVRANHGESVPVVVVGSGASGLLAAYAALLEPEIASVRVIDPPSSHMNAEAPRFLNVLRVLDVPEALGSLAPRPLALQGGDAKLRDRVTEIYQRAGAADRLTNR